MNALITAALVLAFSGTPPIYADLNSEKNEKIVLVLHGMGRTSLSMIPMENFLEESGYRADNWNYDGFFTSIKDLGLELNKRMSKYESDPNVTELVAVTHSLGGIVLRTALQNPAKTKLKTVVMLAPPNQGSSSADRFAPIVSWLFRPIVDLVTTETGFIRSLAKISDEIKIGIISGDSDPLVSHEEAFLDEALEHTRVDASHTFIMWKDRVHQLTLCFLKTQTFKNCPFAG